MIVVIGQPSLERDGETARAAGMPAAIAGAAAARGASVQLVGKVGEDADGDALVLALARAGIGHVAVLRDPARRTPARHVLPEGSALIEPDESRAAEPDGRSDPALEPNDVDLALRYLTDLSVLVVTDPGSGILPVAADASRYANATLIVVAPPGGGSDEIVADDAIVLEAPAPTGDGPFATLVGELAAAIDSGTPADRAFRDLVAAAGWERPAD